tara:strand:+ start:464 stop:697 length:234 start_codon:yes stop_codon:yes gene_type:complete
MPYTKFIKQTQLMTFNEKMTELEKAATAFRDERSKLEIQLQNVQACLDAIQIKRNCLRIEAERERSGQTLFDEMFGG